MRVDAIDEAVPGAATDRRARALDLMDRRELGQAAELVEAELATGEDGVTWATNAIIQAMLADDLTAAGDLARLVADLRYGGRVPPSDPPADRVPGDEPAYRGGRTLSADKLRHDAEQLRYLAGAGSLDVPVDHLVDRYQRIARRLDRQGPETRQPLSDEDRSLVGDAYGRLVHVRDSPRLPRALSPTWDPADVERRYLAHREGVVVIDDFLVPEALDELRAFCLESTVWHANRYPHGRLGAFFDSGFNSPLLLQIAEELQASFPRMIGTRHRLRQLWGFKYPPRLPADSTIHADFAAVNVNFWITRESANRDPSTGGLLIYHTDAPRDWDFRTYNERLDLIKEYLRRSRAEVTYVPYRANRAIIFNSDLFHATGEVNFGTGYAERRVNVTMLYGVREHDDAHTGLSTATAPATAPEVPAWRSAALSRTRRLR